MKLFNPKFNEGILFNGFMDIMVRALNVTDPGSESDFFVKIARMIKRDDTITHDEQIFRDYRANEVDAERLLAYLGVEVPDVHANHHSFDKNSYGAWIQIYYALDGYIPASEASEPLHSFRKFIEGHCKLESTQLALARSSQDCSSTNKFIKEWLWLTEVDLTSENPTLMFPYVIHMIMYWAACFELFLELSDKSDSDFILSKILPTCYEKNGGVCLSHSNEKLVTQVKHLWATTHHGKNKITNTQLFRDILVKQYKDKDIDTSCLFSCEEDTIDPNTDAIKKRFQRIREGKLFTLNQFRKDIVILRRPFCESEDDLAVIIPYLLVNLFTGCQMSLKDTGCDIELIVNSFEKYPELKAKVQERYNHFRVTGELHP
ncbi:hypothetical protein OCL06_15900 [Alteromonas sp. ASW11-19]|uniref:Uncharacterized protein n=1 Tax=Alteromonas salexigens TaxID=2982530 RepID=A0ABT2VRX5_9ALTE|nr:hypothetical protein [Alteromonas salexigens]MCU7556075.1 hypothetical protein [Alteromonas salexigens]